jgi:uncharacterized DUF497 family protein
MNVIFSLQGVIFEWDDEKATQNRIQHGVTFEEATEVFFDPFYQYGDAMPAGVQEQRNFMLSYSVSLRLLLLVFMERGNRSRIISARPATPAERRQYESA